MKKILAPLMGLTILAPVASSVVACGTKPMDSITSDVITSDDGKVLGYDITTWDSSVIDNDKVKSNFIDNLNNWFSDGSADINKIDFLLKTGNNENLIANLIADYESTTATQNIHKGIDGAKVSYDTLVNNLDFTIYDANYEQPKDSTNTILEDQKLATWDNTNKEWTPESNKDLTVKKVDSGGAYKPTTNNMIHVKVEITPKKDNPFGFVGGRVDTVKDDNKTLDFSSCYTDAIVNGSDSVKQQAALYKDNSFAGTDYDYRYDIQFTFLAS